MNKFVLICVLIYLFIVWVIGIIGGCYIVHAHNTDRWRTLYSDAVIADSKRITTALHGFNVHPVVDVKLVDGNCPEDYPDDLLYDIWLGIRAHCDCLQRPEERTLHMDTLCDRGVTGDHKSDACHDR